MMMNARMIRIRRSPRLVATLLALATALAGSHEAVAGTDGILPWILKGHVGFLTDYVDRGVSQSDAHGAVQAQMRMQHSGGLYAALLGSSVDFDDEDEADAELNYILGLERELGRGQVGVSVAYIHYPGAASELEYDLVEFGAHAEHAADALDLSATAIFSPDNTGGAGKALYLTFGLSRQLTESVSLGAHVGRQWHEREDIAGPDYLDWGVELEWSRDRFSAALRFSDTDNERACADTCDARIHAAVSISFRAAPSASSTGTSRGP